MKVAQRAKDALMLEIFDDFKKDIIDKFFNQFTASQVCMIITFQMITRFARVFERKRSL